MNEIEQLTAERDEALASAKRAWDEVGVLNHRCDEYRGRLMQVQPLVDAARAWREARTAFGATRMEQEHDVLWAATDRLEAAVDALTAGKVGTPGAHDTAACQCEDDPWDGSHMPGCIAGRIKAAVDGEIDKSSVNAELADINARVADDERVFTAVGAAVAEIRGIRHVTPAARELMAAWEARAARRALTDDTGETSTVDGERAGRDA